MKSIRAPNFLLPAGMLLLAGVLSVQAAGTTYTVASGASGNWSTATNWAGGVAPTGTQTGNIATQTTTQTTTLALDIATTIGEIINNENGDSWTINCPNDQIMRLI
jgi:hypothetical protein